MCAGCYTIRGNLRSGHTRLLRKKSVIWSYCDASCSNVGQFSYYNHITEKVQCISKCVGWGADIPPPPPPLTLNLGGVGGEPCPPPPPPPPVLMHETIEAHVTKQLCSEELFFFHIFTKYLGCLCEVSLN